MAPPAYKFVEPVASMKASPGRVFVYALLLPARITGGNIVPYLIGSASNLRQRFSNHKELRWHRGRFEAVADVLVVGTVPANLAAEAVTQLKEALVFHGFILLGKQQVGVKQLTDYQLTAYSERKNQFVGVIELWGDEWDLKTRAPKQKKKQNQGSTQAPSLPVPTAPTNGGVLFLPPPADLNVSRTSSKPASQVSKVELGEYLETVRFGSDRERMLVFDILREYDEFKQQSSYWLSEQNVAFLLKGGKGVKFNKFWFTKTRIKPGRLMFYPQLSFLTKAAKKG